jgi:hypothetical protein
LLKLLCSEFVVVCFAATTCDDLPGQGITLWV